MGFGRRLVRKSVRKATPRSVRKAMHPARTVKNAVTPRPMKKISRGAYTVTHPVGAAENAVIGAALYPKRGRRHSGGGRPAPPSPARTSELRSQDGARQSPVGVRAAEAVDVHNRLAALMSVGCERFTPVARPVVAEPRPEDPEPLQRTEWIKRKHEVPWWRTGQRRDLRKEVEAAATAEVAARLATAQEAATRAHQAADAWWQALNHGDPSVLTSALDRAFADNPAPVDVLAAGGVQATLAVHLPPLSVLPPKTAHITPSGRLSSRAWTKTELNEVYAELVGAHLQAAIRETFAVGPSLMKVRILGLCGQDILFDVESDRDKGHWQNDDGYGRALLASAPNGLLLGGRTREAQPWPPGDLRDDVTSLMAPPGKSSRP